MNIKSLLSLSSLAFAAALTLSAAEPYTTNVIVRQRWPWSDKVDIYYTLATESNCDVEVTATYTGAASNLVLTGSAMSGQVSDCASGAYHLVWDPVAANVSRSLPGFAVTVKAVNATNRLYMVVDVATGAITYRPDVPVGGWSADEAYATTKLVLRRIPAQTTFLMGTPETEIGRGGNDMTQHSVTLTKAFYAGIYPVTRAQFHAIYGSDPSVRGDTQTCPVSSVSFNTICGASTDVADGGWPLNREVTTNSFMGLLRKKTGNEGFFLPTEAQWECACRAGTTTAWNNGMNITNATSDAMLDTLGWYKISTSTGGTHAVGQKVANAWGLYDFHGCIFEWCLDRWYGYKSTDAAIDPKGSTDNSAHSIRGGTWYSENASECRAGYRDGNLPGDGSMGFGFRLFWSQAY